MTDSFAYDVFLSHSAKDKDVVRALAERLKADNIRVWFDEWVIKPGDSIPAKVEEDSRGTELEKKTTKGLPILQAVPLIIAL